MANSRVRNGRVIEYTNQTPFETDFLYSNMYNMVNASYLASAVLASGNANATLVAGLACTQNSAPNLTVLIGQGVMFNYQNFDATAYGVINADTASTDNLYKPYIQTTQYNSASLPAGLGTLNFIPPGSGTTNYLLQATFLTTDTDNFSRPFFNPANPAAPTYTAVNQTRWDTIQYSLKSAVSPSIPTPDAGSVGLYVIAVASGATQILNNNITVYSGAPFITESLTQKISYASLQASTPIYGLDTGTANAYAVTATPAYTVIQAGSRVSMKAIHANTAASTLNVSGLGAVAIRVVTPLGLQPLSGGEILVGIIYEFRYDGTYWELLNPSIQKMIGARVGMVSNQNLPGSGTITQVHWDTSTGSGTYDPYSMWSGTPNFYFTVPISGYWVISTSASISPSPNGTAGAGFFATIYVNGSQLAILSENSIVSSSNESAAGSARLNLTAGQTVDIRILNGGNSGTSPYNITLAGATAGVIANFFEIKYDGN